MLARLQKQVGDAQLATLRESLDRNYRLLAGWLSRSAKLQAGGCALEHRLLMIGYAIMRVWYSVARRLSHSRAQQALTEMGGIRNSSDNPGFVLKSEQNRDRETAREAASPCPGPQDT